jgi:hypothetical protein
LFPPLLLSKRGRRAAGWGECYCYHPPHPHCQAKNFFIILLAIPLVLVLTKIYLVRITSRTILAFTIL